MIIRKDKSFEINGESLDVDWYNEGNYIIDETTEEGQQMAQTYIENYPFVDFEHDGEFVTNVIVLDKPEMPEEIEGERIVLKQDEEGNFYYDYEDIPKSEIEIQQEIINTLGKELTDIKLQLLLGGM